MSEDTDEPQIPSECIELIMDYCVYRYLMRDKKFQMASAAYSVYVQKLNAIRQMYWRPNIDPRTAVKVPDVVRGAK